MADKTEFDVAIIGGGLAGLCLAIQCAQRGFSTVLFEKEKYPFHKVCGEYISMESYPFLQSLGLNPEAYNAPKIDRLTITDVKGKGYHFNLPLGGFGISRFTLDNELYQIALAQGVKVVHTKVSDVVFKEERFSIQHNGHASTARVVAGSFGKRSNLDIKWSRPFTTKKAAGKNYVGIKYHVRYPHPKDRITLHNFSDGYCGISAIEDEKCCVCYLTTAAQLQAAGNSISHLQKNILGKNPQLEQIFSTSEFLYTEPLAISQISFAPKSVIENHMLMVGDAAGLITPLCGNGMSMAMHASKICSETFAAFLQAKISRGQMEEQYVKRWKQVFASRLWIGRKVQQFFGHPITTRMFLQTMHGFPSAAKALIKSTHGKPF